MRGISAPDMLPSGGTPLSTLQELLPRLNHTVFVTDSGLETDLIFHHDVELPAFAAFVLLRDQGGCDLLTRYFAQHLEVAVRHGLGCVLETPTWRAGPAWADAVGWAPSDVLSTNVHAVSLVAAAREASAGESELCLISGCVGPRSDGYVVKDRMTAEHAASYHHSQLEAFASTEVDLVSLLTATYPDEAIGFARAATDLTLPHVVSFTVETDGRLPDGTLLGDAIETVDNCTDASPAYYMVNCAHPSHISPALDPAAAWSSRLRGVRANASTKSHAELDEATELDAGDPVQLAADLDGLRTRPKPCRAGWLLRHRRPPHRRAR